MNQADWTEPGAFEVATGVYRIALPLPGDGLRAVNVYAITTETGLVVVDAGWALESSEECLVSALAGLGYQLGDVNEFLVTHAHRDHYSQAVQLRRRFGSRISLGEDERPTLDILGSPEGRPVQAQTDLLERHGAPLVAKQFRETIAAHTRDPSEWAGPDRWIEDRSEIAAGDRTLLAIHTPGHTRGHLVYLDADNAVLFAGDHVLPSITPSIGFEPKPPSSPLRDFLNSLKLLREMPDATLLPAHGPAGGRVHERIDQLIQHHADRLEVTLKALHDGADTAYEVAKRLEWTRRRHSLEDLDLFNSVLAITETAAHLAVLEERGAIRSSKQIDGIHYFL
jgi:glyoxylase-like metal-dependent hydrolase (beta-lactamase superfamily II)